jgi:hypothetical protein
MHGDASSTARRPLTPTSPATLRRRARASGLLWASGQPANRHLGVGRRRARRRGALGGCPSGEHSISAITASELLARVHRAIDGTRRMRRQAYAERVLGEMETLRPHARAGTDTCRPLGRTRNQNRSHWHSRPVDRCDPLGRGLQVATATRGISSGCPASRCSPFSLGSYLAGPVIVERRAPPVESDRTRCPAKANMHPLP